MLDSHAVGVSLVFIFNYLFSAFIEVNVEENKVLDSWDTEYFIQIKVDVMASIVKCEKISLFTYWFWKSASEKSAIFAIF